MALTTRFFSFDDLSPDQGWDLLSWCRTQGADEFTLSALVAPTESHRMKAFFTELDHHRRPAAPRRLLSAPAGGALTREVALWQLTPETERLLREAWSSGFVSRQYDDDL